MAKAAATKAFLAAVLANDVAAAARALDEGADIDVSIPKDGQTPSRRYAAKGPLIIFAAKGNKSWLPMLKLLIARGADLDAKGARGETALIETARDGVTEAVEALLDAGANPNHVDTGGSSLLHNILMHKGHALLQRALQAGAKTEVGLYFKRYGIPRKPTFTPLYHVAISRDARAAKLLLDAGADPDTGRMEGFENYNPLGQAIQKGDKPIIKLLLDAGADIELLDDDRRARMLRLVPNALQLSIAGRSARAARGPVAKRSPVKTPAKKKAAKKKVAKKKAAKAQAKKKVAK
jgi:ankyrin repeat protein